MKRKNEFKFKRTIFFYNLIAMLLNVYIIFKITSVKLKRNDFTLCSNIKPGAQDHDSNEVWYLILNKVV
jgi:hypothetical protein